MLPILAREALVVVYPEDADELCIIVVSLTGECKFGSSGSKILEGGGLKNAVEMRRWAQLPCFPARWIQKSMFLLPEVIEWLSVLATKKYDPTWNYATHKAEDERFFYDYLLPYLKGRPGATVSHRKMIESGPYGHVRFGLHALLLHALGLPHAVYKRVIVFSQLCALQQFAVYFQDPNGLAALPQPALERLFDFLPRDDVKRVLAASRLWGYQVLPVYFGEGRTHLQKFDQNHPAHCRRMEGLYDRLLEIMQGVARKLCKISSRDDLEDKGNHEFTCMAKAQLKLLRSKMSKEGVLANLEQSRDESADLHSALQLVGNIEGSLEIPASIPQFLHYVNTALFAPSVEEQGAVACQPQATQCPDLMRDDSDDLLHGLDALKSWLEAADDENHFRVVVLFEERILTLAMSGDSLRDWPTDFITNSSEATALSIQLSRTLEAYVAVCEKPNQPWGALRHSRIVLVAWTMACLQDVLLREHQGDAFKHVLQDFRPPLAAHALEHLLLPEKRWMQLGHRVESYLTSKAHLKHQLFVPGKDNVEDFIALAGVATSHLPEVIKAWEEAREKAQKAEKEWQDRSDQKDAWANSLAQAIEHDTQLLQMSDQQQPWRRRKTSQTSKRRLAEEQCESRRRRQTEGHALQRPLPAKVEPLPQMSEHEAEARAIIFSIHLPEELSLLGSSFCLARHLWDFDAGRPCEVLAQPAFSWHSHFLEFSTTIVPSLQAAGRFELFADLDATFRSGQQKDSYNLPLNKNIGFYHPDAELEGLQLLWRWQGVLVNPFQTSWPDPNAPPELYRMEFPADQNEEWSEEWILALPKENGILAQLPLHSQGMFQGITKAQFRSLGCIASCPHLHLRRLLPALHSGELPIEDSRVKAVCQQILYRFGPSDVPRCFLGRSCKEDLLELADWPSVKALPEQVQALETERGSIEALTCLMICCSYVAQFEKESHPKEAIQTCRRVLEAWAQEARCRFRDQDQQAPGAEEVRKRFANVLFSYIHSFRLVPADGLSTKEALQLAKARIDLENCLVISGSLLNEADMDAVNEVCFLHEHQLADRNILDELLAEFLPGQQPTVPCSWKAPADSPFEMWRLAHTTDGLVAMHPSRGLLLFNGKPVGYLPREIRSHPQFKEMFSDVTCSACPLAKQGVDIFEAGPVNDKTYVLGLLPHGELFIQEKTMQADAVLTLLPADYMAEVGLRKALVENYTHWFCASENTIWFRPKANSDGRDYSLQVSSGWRGRLICTLKQSGGCKMQVFLPSEPGIAHLVKALTFVEPSQFVEYLGEPCAGKLKEVYFLRLGLKFTVHDGERGRTLKSEDFPGHQLAAKQTLGMLCGFRCFLLLEEARPVLRESSENWPAPAGLVVVPEGKINTQGSHDGFLRCVLQFKGFRRKFSHFKIHWEDGQLEIPTVVGRLQLASLLWACARMEPELLFGRPAQWKALELLRQCWQNQPFEKARVHVSA